VGHQDAKIPRADRERILEVLCRRYVREKQHVMRFCQHAERIADRRIRRALIRIAGREQDHVRAVAATIVKLGGEPPTVFGFHCCSENAWEYLRSDLDDERRCIAEIAEDKLAIGGQFPEIIALLDCIESEANTHREQIRALLSKEARPLWAA
jgi:hypothetical protein